jgi:hypothetical protein
LDDQQVGHLALHLSQFFQEDAQNALLFADEIDPVYPALLHPAPRRFDVRNQVGPVRDGKIRAAPFRVGVRLVATPRRWALSM